MSRRMIPLAAHLNRAAKSSWSFSVAQWNILGGYLAKPKYFPYCNPSLLEWENRKHRILDEVANCSADIICLEELTEYWTFFKTRMRDLRPVGYDSAFMQRPSLHVSYRSGRRKQDGCGIFWKEPVFEALRVESFNLPDRHDRVALAVVLRHRQSQRLLLVANTHLYWDSSKVEEQMEEVRFLDHEIARLLVDLQQKDIPVVLCGDFNNTPDSPVHRYMLDCFLGAKSPRHDPSRVAECCGDQAQPWSDMPALRSAYAKYPTTGNHGNGEDAPFTTLTDRRCSTIDYIFYSAKHMLPTV